MSTSEFHHPESNLDDDGREQEFMHVRNAIRGLRFGTVQIFVQDGVIVQIDRTEKRRIPRDKKRDRSP